MLFSFTGCSGSGKTTLGKFLEENYLITYKEVSARPFLEDLNKSYDEQMTDKIQNRIMYGNLEMVYENLIESQKENIILSRCCIDVLAYARILKHGLDCEYLQEKTIKKLSDKMVILYTIPDFPLTDVDDKLRGMNEGVRQNTDKAIFRILEQLNIPHYTISGNLLHRKELLNEIMNKYNICCRNDQG